MARRPVAFLRSVGEQIRHVREQRGWSQEALAAEAGVDRSYMSGVERGVRNVSLLKLRQIARALGVGTRELLPRE